MAAAKPTRERARFQELAVASEELPSANYDPRRDVVKDTTDTPMPLGKWAEDQRGCPNALIRSAMFCASKPPKRRPFLEQIEIVRESPEEVPALAPYLVKYSGPRLFQPDLDVWLELVHRARALPAGHLVEFPIRAMLRSLGRNDGGSDRDWLVATFTRLRATALDVSWRDAHGRECGYIRGLVKYIEYAKDRKIWRVALDPEVTKLFASDQHTWLNVATRRLLGKAYLAQWVHSYFSSHRKPRPISVQRLRELSGSKNVELFGFRRRLKEALEAVALAELKVERRRFKWSIDADDLVHVVRESGN